MHAKTRINVVMNGDEVAAVLKALDEAFNRSSCLYEMRDLASVAVEIEPVEWAGKDIWDGVAETEWDRRHNKAVATINRLDWEAAK